MSKRIETMMLITPVLLCGGSGTRLWPLSRKSYPKQFAPLLGDQSLFQQAALRLNAPGFAPPLVITHSDFRFIVAEQLQATGIDAAAILLEPSARNTAPAIFAACLHIAATDPDALILAAPADHVIPDAAAFRTAVLAAAPAARAGRIVTFGIRPTRAETGYGWLELTRDSTGLPAPLHRFVEKPDAASAEVMLANGQFLWNSGIFLFSARTLIAAIERHAPDLLPPVAEALTLARPDLGFLRLAPGPWDKSPSVSIDYAVMERATNLSVMPYDAGWSDLGDWAAVWRETPQDGAGNALTGPATALDCEGSLLHSDGTALVGIGLSDIIAIATPDAVLIAPRDHAQEVRAAVDALKSRSVRAAEHFPRDHRPWGFFDALAAGDRFQVKRITVKPGAALSLQSHVHRAEHWIVVSGTARVTIDGSVSLISENQSVYIPLGAKHRLENPGKLPMILIEVQTGAYLGEDDITRYDDIYARD
jgi:mannose-1-phosphate guanylyltransferase / mannose-6-phosphate isomerase